METQVDRWIKDNRWTESQKAEKFHKHIANKATCQWVGDWNARPKEEAARIANHAHANNALYQIVLYNFPNRDTGGFSAGGAGSRQAYIAWVSAIAAGLGSRSGIIIVEPDAIAHAPELDENSKNQRLSLLRETVTLLRKRCKHAYIYLDAGHSDWLDAGTALGLLLTAGVRFANGISLNVSNSQWTKDCYNYGKRIVEGISEEHGIVIDTSRNGAGPPPPEETGFNAFANPPSNRLGMAPTLRVPPPNIFSNRLHALLWVKVPGESDGDYKGAPRAGVFWPDGAMRLVAGLS